MPRPDRPAPHAHLVIALASFAVILFEVAITRLLSVVLWYHFAFLAISVAMLGLGAPGVWFSLRAPRAGLLPKLLVAAGSSIPASVLVVVKAGEWSPSEGLRLALIVLALLVPMLLLGAAICLLLLEARGRRIGPRYAFDLVGAALGALLVVPLLGWVPAPQLVAALAFPVLAGAWLCGARPAWLPFALAGGLAALLAWPAPFQVRHGKAYAEQDLELLYEQWTPTARLTVFSDVFWDEDPAKAFGWGMGDRFEPVRLEQLWIEQDGNAGTPVTRLDGPPSALEHLYYDVTSAGYQLRPPRSVCIVGAGGGRDILTALKSGAARVDAVELNGAIVDIVSERFPAFSGDVYHLPGVRTVVSEGRSFLTRSGGGYDLIQISLIDSWAATAAGAYALSENYLYTLEALRLYLRRTSPGGLVTISRWMGGSLRLEAARLALLARAALEAEGVDRPLAHMAVLRGSQIGTLLLSRTAFRPDEIVRLDQIAAARGFERHWPPPGKPPRGSLVIGALERGVAEFEQVGLHLAPPTDERPFFFQNVRAFATVDERVRERLSVNDEAGLLPRVLLVGVGGLTFVLFLTPFAWFHPTDTDATFWRGSLYFLAIGLAFMWVEIPLIQKFILYLGHPSYATTVVLATILLGSGVGAGAAGRTPFVRLRRARFVLPGAVLAGALALAPLFEHTLGWSMAGRVLLAVVLLSPLGFCMGFAFPAGMIGFGDRSRAWFWAMNGAAGVLASVSAVALAAYIGLTGVIGLGVACYLGAALLLVSSPREGTDVR